MCKVHVNNRVIPSHGPASPCTAQVGDIPQVLNRLFSQSSQERQEEQDQDRGSLSVWKQAHHPLMASVRYCKLEPGVTRRACPTSLTHRSYRAGLANIQYSTQHPSWHPLQHQSWSLSKTSSTAPAASSAETAATFTRGKQTSTRSLCRLRVVAAGVLKRRYVLVYQPSCIAEYRLLCARGGASVINVGPAFINTALPMRCR
jgi:hypothetical protein